jgi:hypothetical protein
MCIRWRRIVHMRNGDYAYAKCSILLTVRTYALLRLCFLCHAHHLISPVCRSWALLHFLLHYMALIPQSFAYLFLSWLVTLPFPSAITSMCCTASCTPKSGRCFEEAGGIDWYWVSAAVLSCWQRAGRTVDTRGS